MPSWGARPPCGLQWAEPWAGAGGAAPGQCGRLLVRWDSWCMLGAGPELRSVAVGAGRSSVPPTGLLGVWPTSHLWRCLGWGELHLRFAARFLCWLKGRWACTPRTPACPVCGSAWAGLLSPDLVHGLQEMPWWWEASLGPEASPRWRCSVGLLCRGARPLAAHGAVASSCSGSGALAWTEVRSETCTLRTERCQASFLLVMSKLPRALAQR